MNLFKKIFGRQTSNGNSSTMLTQTRIQGRLYGFAWTILEKRDPNFNGDQLKGNPIGTVIMSSMSYATDNETAVISKLLDVLKTAPKSSATNENAEGIKGGLEGKLVIYNNINPEVLLSSNDIK